MSVTAEEIRTIKARTEQERLWRRYARGRDPADRERLFAIYLPIARRMASRYAGVAEPYDDLAQVAGLALLNAIDRFDPSKGTPFLGFAKPTIMGELKRHFRDRVWTVRVPRSVHDRIAQVDSSIDGLTRDSGRTPSVAEIAEDLGIGTDEVLDALEAQINRRPCSLDASTAETHGDDGYSLPDRVGDVDADLELIETRLTLAASLPDLDHSEREILRLRFLEDLPQTKIAARIGCSQMQVSRLLRRALDRLHAASELRVSGRSATTSASTARSSSAP